MGTKAIHLSVEKGSVVVTRDPEYVDLLEEAVWDSDDEFTVRFEFEDACPFGENNRVFHRGKHTGRPRVETGERPYHYTVHLCGYTGRAAIKIGPTPKPLRTSLATS